MNEKFIQDKMITTVRVAHKVMTISNGRKFQLNQNLLKSCKNSCLVAEGRSNLFPGIYKQTNFSYEGKCFRWLGGGSAF